jgi:hypothetical protein
MVMKRHLLLHPNQQIQIIHILELHLAILFLLSQVINTIHLFLEQQHLIRDQIIIMEHGAWAG